MSRQRVRRLFGLFLLVAGLVMLAWGLEPIPTQVSALGISPSEMSFVPTEMPVQGSEDAQPSPLLGIPEWRTQVLEWPVRIRAGERAVLRLALEVVEDDSLAAAGEPTSTQSNTPLGQTVNGYDSHRVIAEARLEVAGVEVSPNGEISQAMLPGKPVAFAWTLRPGVAGEYQATAWLHLRFIPRDGEPEVQRLLSAKVVQLQVVDFLGLGGSAARVLGSTVAVLGMILGLDGVIGWALEGFALKSK